MPPLRPGAATPRAPPATAGRCRAGFGGLHHREIKPVDLSGGVVREGCAVRTPRHGRCGARDDHAALHRRLHLREGGVAWHRREPILCQRVRDSERRAGNGCGNEDS
jgi:hypothetical protein